MRAQQGVEFEYVVLDGDSQDGSQVLIDAEFCSAGSPISFWESEQDGGIYDALNKGIHLCKGDVVGFLHADDELAGALILSKVSQCFSDPHVVACYGDLVYVARDNTEKVVRYWRAGSFDPNLLKSGWMPPHPTLYVRRSWYDMHGAFDTRYRIASDYDLMLRLLVNLQPHEKVVYLPEVMVRMRVGGESNRSIKNIVLKSSEDYRALKANGVGGLRSLAMKNLSKLPQFFKKIIKPL